jgi:capsid portal protein
MIRMTRLGDPVESVLPQRINDLEIVETKQIIKYRRYAQSIGGVGKFVWFKEFGDERIMDQITGRFVGRYVWDSKTSQYVKFFEGFASEVEFKKANPQFREATELLYYSLYNAMGIPYPVPRWMGCHTLARGLIASEMVNAEFFDNNMVPPVAIKVSNGRLTAQTRERLESQLETRKRGRENFWKVLTLESESESRSRVLSNTGTPTIEIQPLAEVIPNDATHQDYDEKGRLKLRSQFRLPPAHVGQESQYTRQSIQASKVAAEEQVFQPEREEDDDCYNKFLMPALRINHWLYKTNSPPVADNQQMAQVLSILSKAGLITAGEVRPELEQLFNRPLQKLEDRLTKLPIPLVLIEAKGEQAMKLQASRDQTRQRQSDGDLENPEDKMGGRPDRDGVAIGSEVTKVDAEKANLVISDLLKENPAVLVRHPSRQLEIVTKDENGNLIATPVSVGEA